ncbi:MAG: hypothetical protein WB974_12300, partial [Acidobacteriaceae bacterium]
YHPVPGDHGAHGSFDDRAKDRSWEFRAESHAKTVATALTLGLGIAGFAWKRLSARASPAKKLAHGFKSVKKEVLRKAA